MSAVIEPGGSAVPKAVPPAPETKVCKGCGNGIPIAATLCKDCKTPQYEKPCRTCGALIPLSATVCNACKGFQDWRRRVPGDQVVLALLVALLSVLSTLLPQLMKFINLPSRTTGFFVESALPSFSQDHSMLTVRLMNEGGRPSEVESARIDFGVQGLEPVPELEIVDRRRMIVPPRGKSDVNFFIYDLPHSPATQKDVDRVANLLCTATVNIYVSVRERSRVFGTRQPAKEIDAIQIPARIAHDWVVERLTTPSPTTKECP